MAWSGRAGSRCTYTDDRTESDGETQEWECPHGAIDGRALARWGMNAFLFVTTGYGERASYTLAASAALIAAYAGLYVAIAPDLFGSVGQYAQLSLGSFIAFFLGGVGEVSDPTVSLLAQSEAFLGGFFVALYVFALTRSVSR
ncbi:hypothetical protein [Haloarcula sp. Atlit-47R]|uniref:hypothetical protein n=1 Tax=Haloarcula sp. Atlit-47R TaxID=2282132 RepID=UPI001F310733|nr:hypothetical protein [Haloarcula sp. Atlit-47R]